MYLLKFIVYCCKFRAQVFEDLYHYMQSLAVIQALKPACIYPGHGPVVSDPATHVQMYIDNRNNREKQILSALASGKMQQLFTAMDLVKIIYAVKYLAVVFISQLSYAYRRI